MRDETREDVRVSPRDGKAMVLVAGGDFLRGSTPADGQDSDETPQWRVYLNAYWIDVCPVTVQEYRRFCEATGRQMPKTPRWGWENDHPVVNVLWEDAAAYAAWADKRLPTEAEWEKAARGTDGRKFPWGSEAPGTDGKWRCNLFGDRDGFVHTSPVDHYPEGASPYSCLDMIGNVWEWCADWYRSGYYASAPIQNPTGPERGSYRVMRGASWEYLAKYVQCTIRHYNRPTDTNEGFGFRCVQDV